VCDTTITGTSTLSQPRFPVRSYNSYPTNVRLPPQVQDRLPQHRLAYQPHRAPDVNVRIPADSLRRAQPRFLHLRQGLGYLCIVVLKEWI
jgi:hypothetical protein